MIPLKQKPVLAVNRFPTVLRNMLTTILLTALIAGCSGVRTGASGDSRLQQQARTLEASGNYQGAAQLYLQAAAQATGSEQQAFKLQAAASLIRGEDYPGATRLLDELPAAQLSGEVRQHYVVNRAAIAVVEQHPGQALTLLGEVPASGPYVADYRRLRAEAYLQESRFFLSARERVLLDPLLTAPEQQLENEFAIWEALNRLTDTELQQLRTTSPPDPLGGWMELVELTRLYLQQPDTLTEVVPHWQQRYPNHPASSAFIPKLLESMRSAGQPPERLALLLPLNGKLADAAEAIRDGVLAAYYDTPAAGSKPQLQVYDSGETPGDAVAAYQQAIAAGAQFVIGPLRKEDVQALASQPQLAVPVLALNQIEDSSLFKPSLFQFGLAPEDEAREVARLAWREGFTRSIALLPNTEWGERVYAAFAVEWQLLGGDILETERYDNTRTDHGKLISSVLKLDSSKARQQQLTRHLGINLEFEPRRRQDVDFVFLVASSRQARLIRPQLRFYRASSLPVYTTSSVYSGRPDANMDADMNGIIFCDMPWTLETGGSWDHMQRTINASWPASASRYRRLYALGIDAYRLTPYLGELGNNMFGAYHGVTGNLSLGRQGHINRTLRCAKFSGGLPVLLEAAVGNETANETASESTDMPAGTADHGYADPR
jgi:outer membrane PBP1 activator LpoA protein